VETFIIAAILCTAGKDCQEIRLSPNQTFETRAKCESSQVTLWIHASDSVKIRCVLLREWESQHPPQRDDHGP